MLFFVGITIFISLTAVAFGEPAKTTESAVSGDGILDIGFKSVDFVVKLRETFGNDWVSYLMFMIVVATIVIIFVVRSRMTNVEKKSDGKIEDSDIDDIIEQNKNNINTITTNFDDIQDILLKVSDEISAVKSTLKATGKILNENDDNLSNHHAFTVDEIDELKKAALQSADNLKGVNEVLQKITHILSTSKIDEGKIFEAIENIKSEIHISLDKITTYVERIYERTTKDNLMSHRDFADTTKDTLRAFGYDLKKTIYMYMEINMTVEGKIKSMSKLLDVEKVETTETYTNLIKTLTSREIPEIAKRGISKFFIERMEKTQDTLESYLQEYNEAEIKVFDKFKEKVTKLVSSETTAFSEFIQSDNFRDIFHFKR
jgi:hypothetical protein